MLGRHFLLGFVALAASVAASVATSAAGPAGGYRLIGEPDVASEILLLPDGSFRYFLAAGALDERAEGRWAVEGSRLILRTHPKPIPPGFEKAKVERTQEASMVVRVIGPNGGGIAGVDVRVGFDDGEPVEGYTQEYGWSLAPGEKREPRWLELSVPMHALASPRIPLDLKQGNAFTFALIPNDIGVMDLEGVPVEITDAGLVVRRGGATLTYARTRDE